MTRYSDPFTSEVGMTLLRVVRAHPGIHFRELARTAHLSSVGQLRHHLDRLEHNGALVELEDGRFKRFFVAGDHDPHLRPALALFARATPHRIGMLLLQRPMTRTEIRRNLACADSTLGFHLKRMVASGDLTRERGRNCCIYHLTNPELVRTVLMMQHGALVGPADPATSPTPPQAPSAPRAIPGLPPLVDAVRIAPLSGGGDSAERDATKPSRPDEGAV
ncbi:MAG: winged helix-turn-helix transcriptional regulator [Thermoplasmatota archaeon]